MMMMMMMILDEQRHYGSGGDGDMAHQQATQIESSRVELCVG